MKLDPVREAALARDRHREEIRMLLQWRNDPSKGIDAVKDYLNAPAVKGRRKSVLRDYNDQFRKGNTGKGKEWR